MKPVLYGAAVAAALVLVGAVYVGRAGAAAPQSTFVLLDGTSTRTADLRGQVTLVNFWATNCTPCIAEMPRIAAAYDRYHAQGFDAVAVAMRSDRPADVALYSESRRLPFKVAIDSTGEVGTAWNAAPGASTMVLLNRRGEVVRRFAGDFDFDEVQRLVEKLLSPA
jgi:thiol-disulfide isomerase/thioredoxin